MKLLRNRLNELIQKFHHTMNSLCLSVTESCGKEEEIFNILTDVVHKLSSLGSNAFELQQLLTNRLLACNKHGL